jgi:hypothetical protein
LSVAYTPCEELAIDKSLARSVLTEVGAVCSACGVNRSIAAGQVPFHV